MSNHDTTPKLVSQQVRRLAAQLLADPGDEGARLAMWHLLGRLVSPEQVTLYFGEDEPKLKIEFGRIS